MYPDSAAEKNRKTVQLTVILKIIPRESSTRKKSNHRGIWCPERPTLFYGQSLQGWVTCPGDSLFFIDHQKEAHMSPRPFGSRLPCDQNKPYYCLSSSLMTSVPDNASGRKREESRCLFHPRTNYVCTTRANLASHHSPWGACECGAPTYIHSPCQMLCSLESLQSIPHSWVFGQKFFAQPVCLVRWADCQESRSCVTFRATSQCAGYTVGVNLFL